MPSRNPYTPRHLAERILSSRSALEGERKQVSVMFADVKGSMELAGTVGAEEWHRILDRFFRILTEGVHRFEGTINQYTGDGIMALFGAPLALEDHAHRACFAALWLRDALRQYAQELRRQRGFDFATRIGINSGDVVVGAIGDDLRMDYTAQGHVVGLAQRMEALAEAGKVYISESTAHLVQGFFALENLGSFAVRGVREPMHVFSLEGSGKLRSRFDRARSRGLTPFVGRDHEMRQLQAALSQALAGRGLTATIVAPPGTGKSRLCFEFAERCRAQGVTVLGTQALAHGRSIPLRPLLDLFRQRFSIAPHDSDRAAREKIAGALLLLDPSFVELLPLLFEFMGVADTHETFLAIDPEASQRRVLEIFRRVVEADSRGQTVVVLFEDMHWVDTASARFVAELANLATTTRLLLLLNFRPEFRAAWLPNRDRIELEPLSRQALRFMLKTLLGEHESVQQLSDQIYERSAGNPFFAEEMIQAWREDGVLLGNPGAYVMSRASTSLRLPESVYTVLAARIDRLPQDAKRVLQDAAVIGRDVPGGVLAPVCEIQGESLTAALSHLRQHEMLYETTLYPDVDYAFKHPLTQEVAYQSQLAERRQHVHRLVAGALESAAGDRLDEQAAEIAWHWEKAVEPAAAARWHRRAAMWLMFRDAHGQTQHWRAVCDLLPELPADREDAALLIEACWHLLSQVWAFGVTSGEADTLFARGLRAAEHHRDERGELFLRSYYADSQVSAGHIIPALEQQRACVPLIASLGDENLRTAWLAKVGFAEGFAGNLPAAEELFDAFLARAPADRMFDFTVTLPLYFLVLSWKANLAALRGRGDEAAGFIQELREPIRSAGNPVLQVLCATSVFEAACLLGGLPAELETASRVVAIAEQYGAANQLAAARGCLARAHLLRGENAAAIAVLDETVAFETERRLLLEWQGFDLEKLAWAHLGLGDLRRAAEIAAIGLAVAIERGSTLQELQNSLVLARTMNNNSATDRILARCETLIAATDARAYTPHILEIRAAQAAAAGDLAQAGELLASAAAMFVAMGAGGHAARLAGKLRAHPSSAP